MGVLCLVVGKDTEPQRYLRWFVGCLRKGVHTFDGSSKSSCQACDSIRLAVAASCGLRRTARLQPVNRVAGLTTRSFTSCMDVYFFSCDLLSRIAGSLLTCSMTSFHC
eukprot:1353930-Amphidinium_carterae.1